MIKQQLSVTTVDRVTAYHVNQLVSVAAAFDSTFRYEIDRKTANGKSIIGMISLGLKKDLPFTLTVDGVDEAAAFAALKSAIEGLK